MLIIDVALLALLSARLVYDIYDIKKGKTQKRLAERNEEILGYMLTEKSQDGEIRDPKIAHQMREIARDTAYRSFWTYHTVDVKIFMCDKCQLTSKVIVNGMTLAKKVKCDNVEGFYLGGVRLTADPGCLLR